MRLPAGQGPEKGLHFSPNSSQQTQNFTGKEKNQDFRSLLPLLRKRFGDPLSYGLTLRHCAQPSHPTSCPYIHGRGGAGLADRMEMAALATLVRVTIDIPVQGWPQAFRKWGHTCTYGLCLEPHPGSCWTM